MNRILTAGLISMLCTGFASCQNNATAKNEDQKMEKKQEMNLPDSEWKKKLSPEQYEVLRNKATEPAGTGKFNLHHENGVYMCAGCGAELFSSNQKFDSHCGWPSFDNELGGGDRIKKVKDFSYGMIRTEIVCAKCGGHLGHIFDDGPTATGQRYCVNSLSLDFKKEDPKK
jgi:peptide-methionine (R)-S-oxide reductase